MRLRPPDSTSSSSQTDTTIFFHSTLEKCPLFPSFLELLRVGACGILFAQQKKSYRSEQNEIDSEMLWKTPVLTGVTKTTAGDIEPANFCCDSRAQENQDECT